MRNRISIVKEDRIWQLRCQGYCYESIASIVNCSPISLTRAIRRVRRRPPFEVDPIKRGRFRGFLSDDQVSDIRSRAAHGETYLSISKDYDIEPSSIHYIVHRKTYKEPSGDSGYNYNFSNRLMR